MDLLTPAEHEAMDLTAQLCRLMGKIIGNEEPRHQDVGEFVTHIHVIQRMILAQAAARAYPTEYRLLGCDIPE